MKKYLIGSVIGILLPFIASASVNNVLFDNGTGNVTVQSGASVNVHLYVTSSGTDVESAFVKFTGAGGVAEQGVCYDISPDQIGTSPVDGWNIEFSVTAPVNAGTWPISIATYGVAGNGADNTCSGSVGFGPTSFANRVTVTTDNSTGTQTQNSGGTTAGSNSWQVAFANLQAQMTAALASINTAIANLSHPATPVSTPSTSCTEYNSLRAGLYVGSDTRPGGSVGKFQSFLMYKGFNIPLLAANQAPYGYFGVQTNSASMSFAASNGCN